MPAILATIPALSVLSVALLTLFNVGYFSKIGIHLLGLVDVSNLVYSFGLAWGLVSIVFIFVNGDTAKWIRDLAQEDGFIRFLLKGWKYFALPLLIVSPLLQALPRHPWVPTLVHKEAFWPITLFIAVLWLSAIVYVRHLKDQDVFGIEIAGVALLSSFLIFFSGRAQAEFELTSSDRNLYTLTMKETDKTPAKSLKDVRVVRSSSSGFIVAIEDHVSFVPKDEVSWVQSQRKISARDR